MAGIYIHIPFCSSKCHYCNFYSVASEKLRSGFIEGILEEIALSRDYLSGKEVSTLYFGGGTPSMLPSHEIGNILDVLAKNHPISPEAEITIEANPEQITIAAMRQWKDLGINRISIGIQSFNDQDLGYLGRKHTAQQSLRTIKEAQDIGFTNISIDLIFGIPEQETTAWNATVGTALSLKVPHISAYALTLEPGTALAQLVSKGKMQRPSGKQAAKQFLAFMDSMTEAGYLHYEISNYCLPGMESRHNSAYWTGKPYLGIGPSAHSFNIISRKWNVASISEYLKGIRGKEPIIEQEQLSVLSTYNEYVMTSLRTSSGCNTEYILANFGSSYHKKCAAAAEIHLRNGNLTSLDGILKLSRQGKLFADRIASDMFVVEDDDAMN